ncbi:MAG: DUF2971 domain-containing protein [Planctomycetota bacterium]
MALYKFVTQPDVARFVVGGVVKFSPIAELNDPSELSPTLIPDEVAASLRRLRQDGYSSEDIALLRQQGALLRRLAPMFQAVPVPDSPETANALIRSSFYDDMALLEQLLTKTARVMSESVGLFCLSRRLDSLPMWAHYASNAAGFAVEFRDLEMIFSGDDTGVLRRPIEVRYDRELTGVSFEPRSHESLFFNKFSDWSYEQEVRVVIPLDECTQKERNGSRLYLLKIPQECIARVIVGWNMPEVEIARISDDIRQVNPTVQFARAVFAHGRVEVSRA